MQGASWVAATLDLPYATDSHREEQQREEDRGDPERRDRQGGRLLQDALLRVVRRVRRRPDDDRPEGPRAQALVSRVLQQLAGDESPRSDRRRSDQGADGQERGPRPEE